MGWSWPILLDEHVRKVGALCVLPRKCYPVIAVLTDADTLACDLVGAQLASLLTEKTMRNRHRDQERAWGMGMAPAARSRMVVAHFQNRFAYDQRARCAGGKKADFPKKLQEIDRDGKNHDGQGVIAPCGRLALCAM